MEIRSKTEFFRLWELGVLGNRTRLWRDPTIAFWEATLLKVERIGFREIGAAGGGAWEATPITTFWEVAERWEKSGRKFIMDDGCPDEFRTLQGEICRTVRGVESFLEVGGRLPMRKAMAVGLFRSYGYAATLVLLRDFMDGTSQDDLFALLDLYPDATIEFSCFSRNVGVFPNRNTLIWEVRCY